MSISGDSLLISLTLILLPSLLTLLGVIIYSYIVIKRYKHALSRLFRSSFRGVDSERKRIASELHDYLALHTISFNEDMNLLKSTLNGNDLNNLHKLENNFNLFKHKTHQIVEYMYPKVLLDLDWKASFQQLANELSIGSINVEFESFASSFPKYDWIFHTYWAIKEIVTNAIRHGNAENIQITATDEDNLFILAIHYLASDETKKWIDSKPSSNTGLGNLIIQDRLSIAGAKMKIEIIDGVVTQSIILKNEDINIR
jgi:signal transduction histidine kinase